MRTLLQLRFLAGIIAGDWFWEKLVIFGSFGLGVRWLWWKEIIVLLNLMGLDVLGMGEC